MTKFNAFGTKLLKSDVAIAQVKAISGPGLSIDTVDVTTHDSTEGWEEVVVTILRSGEVTLDIVYDPAIHDSLTDQMVSKLSDDYELQFPDDAYTSFTFDAFITSFEPSAPVEDALTASVTLKITGVPILDAVYSP